MRLYKLIRRVGKRRRRPYPWFEAPAAGAPLKYFGWLWSPELSEWIVDDLEKIKVQVPYVTRAKPELPFEPGGPDVVLGWVWNTGNEAWEKTPVPRSGKYVLQPHPPKPESPPSRDLPAYVPGWYYDFNTFQWVEQPYGPFWIWVAEPHPPKPDYIPGPSGEDTLRDWVWDYEYSEWVPIIRPVAVIEFEPPRSLPPGIDEAGLQLVYPLEEQYVIFIQNLQDQGLAPHEAKRVAEIMGKAVMKTIWAQQKGAHQNSWQAATELASARMGDLRETLGLHVFLGLIAAAVGVFIGYTMQRAVFVDEDYISMGAHVLTYLLGPDDWIYSRNIGQSALGQHWFSSCEDIGTYDTRHKKSDWKGGRDTIDFPGGFVESGYKFPYWVKYVWEYWEIEYVGFLRSAGQGFYVLKPGEPFQGPFQPGQTLPPGDWCYAFKYYL